MKKINIIDSHTGGEPTRLVIDGFPDLGTGDMASRRRILAEQFDHFRKTVILEPRGNDVIVGALLCQPVNPKASAGVIFFNNYGYLNMCGHGTIGLIASLAYLNKITIGTHLIETPVGDIEAILHADTSISIRNVTSYRYKKNISVDVDSIGSVRGDIAWGGNWFFLISEHGQDLNPNNIDKLTAYSSAVKAALITANITGKDGQIIDHIELFANDEQADSRNFVLCPGQAYDRSPCGTGTSAKIACLAAEQKLKPQQVWTQASIIGSQFKASYDIINDEIHPIITGNAYISAETTLIIDEQDPFRWGITYDN